jgi:branched-subunit amino acid transport protein
MNIFLILLLGGLLTFGIRMSFIFLFGKISIPESVKRALRFVPPAVLSAMIAPALIMAGDAPDLGPGNLRLWAGIIAILVAWRTKNTLLTILSGMAALVLLMAAAAHF